MSTVTSLLFCFLVYTINLAGYGYLLSEISGLVSFIQNLSLLEGVIIMLFVNLVSAVSPHNVDKFDIESHIPFEKKMNLELIKLGSLVPLLSVLACVKVAV